MNSLEMVSQNKILTTALVCWIIAQILKGLVTFWVEKRINFKRFVQAGGMPSSHSALMAGLTFSCGFQEGWTAPITAVAIVVSLIVMYDAAGVRRAAGKQAAILNKVIDELFAKGYFAENRLIEFLGHTPVEVFTGALLGLLVAFLVYY
ncbi:MAG: divergent PAP2 family protein [Bacillota bacterium]